MKRNIVKIMLLLITGVFAIITQTGCGDKEVSRTDFCLNTTCTITVYGMSSHEAEDAVDKAFEEIGRYEGQLSRTIEDSDVYKINHSPGRAVEVSEDTVAVIEEGIRMGELSGGKFDITVGRLTEMWNFTGEKPEVPQKESIDEAVAHIGYDKIKVHGNTVTLEDTGAAIDLGGIAKGYIADRICELLEDEGAASAVINLGGNVAVLGTKENGEQWNIGVERPYSDRSEVVGAVKAEEATIVTSGIYERNFTEGGILYHHVLDPATGYPAETNLEAVTIKAKKGNSAFCDGLSTTCLMLGKDDALKLIEELRKKYPDMGLEAVFIDKDDNIVQTDGMNMTLTK